MSDSFFMYFSVSERKLFPNKASHKAVCHIVGHICKTTCRFVLYMFIAQSEDLRSTDMCCCETWTKNVETLDSRWHGGASLKSQVLKMGC